jgi:protoheme IX farnesyltransferase
MTRGGPGPIDRTLPGGAPMARAAATPRAADFLALARPRLNLLVVASTAAGYYLGAARFDPNVLLKTVVGTALVAGGASAFNQVVERDIDGLMQRTRSRPLPEGRLSAPAARWFAAALSAAGLLQLAVSVNVLTMTVALTTLLVYTLAYTPLKKRTPLATVVGGIPGALPPVIGWSAGRGALSVEALVLFAIVFLWQMPHFLAIAWLYRDDSARAGLRMLPVVQPDGRSTAAYVVLYAVALVPVSLLPAFVGLTSRAHAAAAALLGVAFLAVAIRFAFARSRASARMLFLGSIVYLPLLWVSMIVSRQGV